MQNKKIDCLLQCRRRYVLHKQQRLLQLDRCGGRCRCFVGQRDVAEMFGVDHVGAFGRRLLVLKMTTLVCHLKLVVHAIGTSTFSI